MEGKLTLGYWAIRGLVQRARQLLEYCELPYDEIRYTMETKDQWFNQMKPKLIQKNSAVTLPFLLDGDKVISESNAIMVYICCKAGKEQLLGRNSEEKVLMATAFGVFKDMHAQYIKLAYTEYGTGTEQQAKKLLKDYSAKFSVELKKFNGLLGDKFMAGQLTWIDFALGEFFQVLRLLDDDLMKQFPRLVAYQEKVWNIPQIKKYLSSDKYHQRPINNSIAKWK